MGPLARKAALTEHNRTLESFNRFNESFVEAYNSEQNKKKLPVKESQKQLMKPLDDFINHSTIQELAQTMRLSKRMARMGVASRR